MTTGSDRCCTITSRGRPRPRCPAITAPQTMCRTVLTSRTGRGPDWSARRNGSPCGSAEVRCLRRFGMRQRRQSTLALGIREAAKSMQVRRTSPATPRRRYPQMPARSCAARTATPSPSCCSSPRRCGAPASPAAEITEFPQAGRGRRLQPPDAHLHSVGHRSLSPRGSDLAHNPRNPKPREAALRLSDSHQQSGAG